MTTQTVTVRVLYNDAATERATGKTAAGVRISEQDRSRTASHGYRTAIFDRDDNRFQPGDPLLEVHQFELDVDGVPVNEIGSKAVGEAFTMLNVGHPDDWQFRSMCAGDVVVVGEAATALDLIGHVPADISGCDIKPG